MAKTKSPGADKFRVGQTVAFVLDNETGYERHNGKLTVILHARVFDKWRCSDSRYPERGERQCVEWRYTVRCPEGGGPWRVAEYMLRDVYDGEKLTSWERFAKKTGIDPRAKPVRRKRQSA